MAKTCKRNFWAAVLDESVENAESGVTTHTDYTKYIFMEGSRAWLCTENREILSLLWICTVLDLNPIILPTLLAEMDSDVARFNA